VVAGHVGDWHGLDRGPFESEMRFAFTQTPATTGSISASATFTSFAPEPPSVPEPSSIVMSLTGLAGVVIYRLRRRRRDLAVA